MKCRDAIKIVAKQNNKTGKLFIANLLVVEKCTFEQLRQLINSYGYSYPWSTVRYAARQFYDGPLPFKRRKVKQKRKFGKRDKGSFWNKRSEENWNITAKILGYKNVYEMLTGWRETETKLAACIGVSAQTLLKRRKILKIKRHKISGRK